MKTSILKAIARWSYDDEATRPALACVARVPGKPGGTLLAATDGRRIVTLRQEYVNGDSDIEPGPSIRRGAIEALPDGDWKIGAMIVDPIEDTKIKINSVELPYPDTGWIEDGGEMRHEVAFSARHLRDLGELALTVARSLGEKNPTVRLKFADKEPGRKHVAFEMTVEGTRKPKLRPEKMTISGAIMPRRPAE